MDIKKYLKEKQEEYKKKKADDKRFLKRQKEVLKEQEKLEEEIEKQYKEEVKREEAEKYKDMSKSERRKKDIKEFIDDMLNNSEFEELKSEMTEEQFKEYEDNRKFEKRFTLGVLIGLASFVILTVVGILILGEVLKTDLEKITQPLLEEYYSNTIGDKFKMDSIKYLDKDKHIVLATFDTGINVMCIDNDTIGNDSKLENTYNDYKILLNNTINGTHMIMNNPKLVYRPYLVEYNYYIDYIDVLPSSKTFNEMLDEHNLDIIDIIIYEGDINISNISNMLNNFGDNSIIYLVKMSSQNILNLSIVTKNEVKSFDVVETKFSGNDTFYMFDNNINKIGSVEISNYSPGYDMTNKYYYSNVKELKTNQVSLYGLYGDKDKRSNYYIIKLNKELNYDNFVVLDRTYEEVSENRYPNVITIRSATGLIIIGDKEIMLANKEEKSNSFLCRLNLC